MLERKLLLLLAVLLLLPSFVAWELDGRGVVQEDDFSKLIVVPHTATPYNQIMGNDKRYRQDNWLKNKTGQDRNVCVAYRFDQQLIEGKIERFVKDESGWVEKSIQCEYEYDYEMNKFPNTRNPHAVVCYTQDMNGFDYNIFVKRFHSYDMPSNTIFYDVWEVTVPEHYVDVSGAFSHAEKAGLHYYYMNNPVVIAANDANRWRIDYKPASTANGKWDLYYYSGSNCNCILNGTCNYVNGLDPWYNDNWTYRASLTINSALVADNNLDQNHTKFPLLVTEANLPDSFWGIAQDDGEDVVFTSADGSTKLFRELVDMNSDTNTFEAWVDLNVNYGEDTIFYIYWGNPNALETNDEETWDSNYAAVWHLDRNDHTDSTSNNNDGTAFGFNQDDDSNTTAIGKIGLADKLDGVDSYVIDADGIGISGSQNRTMMLWAKTADTSEEYLIGWGLGLTGQQWGIRKEDNGGELRLAVFTGNRVFHTSPNVADGSWHMIAVVLDGSVTADIDMYQNGSPLSQQAIGAQNVNTADENFNIGREIAIREYFNGFIDEVTVTATNRDGNWIYTAYRNQNNPGEFLATGTTEPALEGWYNSNWDYRAKLTIDHALVAVDSNADTNHTKFPVLVTEDNVPASFWNDVQADGEDVVFTKYDGTTKLFRELVDLNTETEKFEAWVDLNVNWGKDTRFFIYWGNAGASETNDEEIWDINYLMVQHLDRNTHIDSTSNSNDGTAINFDQNADSNTTAIGKIGLADRYDGDEGTTPSYVNLGNFQSLAGTSEVTMSGWFNADYLPSTSGENQGIFIQHDSFATDAMGYRLGGASDGVLCYVESNNVPARIIKTYATVNVTVGTWHYFVLTFDSGVANMYMDGAFIDTDDKSGDFTLIPDITNDMLIGVLQFDEGEDDAYDGMFDEGRVSDKLRDGNWIYTQYRNQNNPAEFITEGARETKEGVSCGDTITANTVLTEDLTGCSANGLVIGANNITLDCNNYSIISAFPTGGDGVWISNKPQTEVKNCDINGFENGIYFTAGSTDSNIHDNNINEGTYGIYLYNDSDRIRITNNIISYNSAVGLTIREVVDTNSSDNNIYQNKWGIYISLDARDNNFYGNNIFSTVASSEGLSSDSTTEQSHSNIFFDGNIAAVTDVSVLDDSNLFLINTQYVTTSLATIDANLYVGWWLDVNVIDGVTQAVISGADVNIDDQHGNRKWSGSTNANGIIDRQWVFDFNQTGSGSDLNFYSPYDINVTAATYDANGITISVDENKEIIIRMTAGAVSVDITVSFPTTCTEGKGATTGTSCDRIWFQSTCSSLPCTEADINADGQLVGTGFLNITQSGTATIDVNMNLLTAAPSGLSMKAGLSQSAADANAITDTTQLVIINLVQDANQMVWVFGSFTSYSDANLHQVRDLNTGGVE